MPGGCGECLADCRGHERLRLQRIVQLGIFVYRTRRKVYAAVSLAIATATLIKITRADRTLSPTYMRKQVGEICL